MNQKMVSPSIFLLLGVIFIYLFIWLHKVSFSMQDLRSLLRCVVSLVVAGKFLVCSMWGLVP